MPVVSGRISSTLTTLLSELRGECVSTTKLIHQLEIEHLTEEQMEDVLGELMASVTHLQMHSKMAKEVLEKD
ncbi:MAG: hypothetical protein ACE5KZ_15650 [Candidatus Scalinduaceae bacterium]